MLASLLDVRVLGYWRTVKDIFVDISKHMAYTDIYKNQYLKNNVNISTLPMSLKDQYRIEKIDYKKAMELVVENHYLHRKAPCSFAYGLVDNNDVVKGVVTYGTPSSSSLRAGVCGVDEKNNVIELTRLWISDDCPRNSESFLIGNTMRLVDKEILVSYADASVGHIGYVYQATNWLYTGLSAKRSNWVVEGLDLHCQTLADKYTATEIREKYGDAFKIVPRPRKHRYVFFNAKGRRLRELNAKLKYKTQPYPKADK